MLSPAWFLSSLKQWIPGAFVLCVVPGLIGSELAYRATTRGPSARSSWTWTWRGTLAGALVGGGCLAAAGVALALRDSSFRYNWLVPALGVTFGGIGAAAGALAGAGVGAWCHRTGRTSGP